MYEQIRKGIDVVEQTTNKGKNKAGAEQWAASCSERGHIYLSVNRFARGIAQ